MSVSIKLYINTTENNRVDKSSHLSDLTAKTVTGSFRTPVDILNPTVLINLSITEATKYNYMYIADFKRYYFITGIVLKSGSTYSAQESSGLFEISGHVDVLYSYKTKITANNALIGRQENRFLASKFTIDRNVEFSNFMLPTDVPFSADPFKIEYDPNDADFANKNNVVMVISNKIEETLGSYPTLTGIKPFIQPNPCMTTLSMTRSAYCMNYGRAQAIIKYLNSTQISDAVVKELFGQTIDAVISIMIFPFDVKTHHASAVSTNLDRIYLGNSELGTCEGYLIKRNYNAVFDFGYVDLRSYAVGDFRDFEPFTTYQIYLPYIGFANLPANECSEINVGLKYAVDVLSGVCEAVVYDYDDTNKHIIYTAKGQMGIQCPITSSNAQEILRNGILTTSNAIKTVASGGSPVTAFLEAGMSMALDPYKQVGEMPGSGIGMWMPSKAHIIVNQSSANNFSDIAHYHGYVCGLNKTLSTLSGYTEVEKIHLENMDPATSTEVGEIEQLLKSGVIL